MLIPGSAGHQEATPLRYKVDSHPQLPKSKCRDARVTNGHWCEWVNATSTFSRFVSGPRILGKTGAPREIGVPEEHMRHTQ